MSKRSNEFLSMQQAVNEMLDKNKLQKGITELDVVEAWKQVMGTGVVTYTKEIKFKSNILYVKLSSSALREELSYGKSKIIDILNEHLGKTLINTIKLS